jgi:prophage regulatory protein
MVENRLERVYRQAELTQFTGLKRSRIEALMKRGEFPRPVPLTNEGRAVGWLESDLVAWQNSRVAAR